jgi:hypothetical protein
MRWWRDRWPEYIPRPKVRRLTEKEKGAILATMTRAVAASPVLSYLGVQVRALRGRFYLERKLKEEGEPAVEILGRITPLAGAKGALLLEVERRNGNWHEVDQGSAQKLIKVVASDTKGKFHGLGSVDKVLRKAKGVTDPPLTLQVRRTLHLRRGRAADKGAPFRAQYVAAEKPASGRRSTRCGGPAWPAPRSASSACPHAPCDL